MLLALPAARTLPAPVAVPPGAPASAPLLAVRRVTLPEYVVARRVRYRADPATLAEWPNTYWAERIEVGVSREFTAALRQQLPGWALCETRCGDQTPTLDLQVDLVPLDFVRSERMLHAGARITVSAGGLTPRVLAIGESAHDLPANADSAQGQAQAITDLIAKIAAEAAPLVRNAQR